jgi:hypothetical protein
MRILTTSVCETPLFLIAEGVEVELPDDLAIAFIADGKAERPHEAEAPAKAASRKPRK